MEGRFDTGTEHDEQNSQNKPTAQNDKNGKKVTNVKNEWSAKSVYLPDDLHGDLESEYKRLDYELDEYRDEFGKVRHYYPLVVRYGLDQLQEMDGEDVHIALNDL
jgi:hypothetical protein